MTCIVGVVENGEVFMGTDSAVTWGAEVYNKSGSKICRKIITTRGKGGDVPILFGTSGSAALGQVLEHILEMPVMPNVDADPMSYLVKNFVPAWRECVDDNGRLKKDNNESEVNGHVLIALQGKLFMMGAHFFINEMGSYYAIGSGGEVALGVLYTTEGKKPKERVTLALETAEKVISSVRSPFHIEKL